MGIIPALFILMQGTWTGDGIKSFPVTDEKVRVEVRTVTEVQGDLLVSRNHFKETPVVSHGGFARSREYDRVYWLRFKGTGSEGEESYEMGPGAEGLSPATQGSFKDFSLVAEQTLENAAGGPPLRIQMRTRFDPQGPSSVYRETITQQEREISNAEITFRRAAQD